MNIAWFNLTYVGLIFTFVSACQYVFGGGVGDMKLVEVMKREKTI